jgi:hypothetical protein
MMVLFSRCISALYFIDEYNAPHAYWTLALALKDHVQVSGCR